MNIENLQKQFDFKQVKGWIALHPKSPVSLTGFNTSRIGKIVDGLEFQFSIGTTKLGEAHNLNETIRTLLIREHIEVIERFSTDGTKKPKKEYPGFTLDDVKAAQFERLIYQVLGAIVQIQQEKET